MNDEKLLILKMLQEGKITPDEAEKLLAALDEQPEATEREPMRTGTRPRRVEVRIRREALEEARRAQREAVSHAREIKRRVTRELRDSSVWEGLRAGLEEGMKGLREGLEAAGEGIRIGMDAAGIGLREGLGGLREGFAGAGWVTTGRHRHRGEVAAEAPADVLGLPLVIRNINGAITVKGGAEKISATCLLTATGPNAETAAENWQKLRVGFEVEEGQLVLRVRNPEKVRWGWSCDFTVSVPEGTDLIVHSINGNISVARCRGRLVTEAVNGDSEVVGAEGPLKMTNVNGRVGAKEVSADEVEISNVNGNIQLQGKAGATARWKASAVHGDLRLRLAESNVQVQARAAHGRLTASGLEHVQREHGWLRGTVGEGSGEIALSTVHGNIEMEAEGGE
ncbi:MAG: DUF4097 family beta strand repeat-containing protein [Bacillota bacterium]